MSPPCVPLRIASGPQGPDTPGRLPRIVISGDGKFFMEGGDMRQDFWFHHPFRVRYSEVDAQAVVFNAHYLTYFDTAITEYFRALGYDYLGEVERSGVDFHLVRSVIEYKAPIRFDEE